jgi:hypothetical protein
MKIVEELQDIDKRLIESLTKENLSPEERDALIEARADLVRASSRMLTAKILDPDEYKKLSESTMKEIAKTLTK